MEVGKGTAYPFGATAQGAGVNFALYGKEIEKNTLVILDEKNQKKPLLEVDLDPAVNKTGDVWHAHVKGLPSVFVYVYRAKLKDREGVHELLDPYAKAVASDPHWHDQPDAQAAYNPKGKYLSPSTFDWGQDRPLQIPMHDLILYEMHVRGLTKDPSSHVRYPGTYRGVIEKIPYLLDLGINAIELMPIQEFNEQEALHVNPETQARLHNYFGYSTVNFFAPMNRYASQSMGDGAIVEFKEMVRELHKNGIEVILDVVFNHTFEGNEKGPIASFKGLDTRGYYMVNPEGAYLNFSGCGNTFNCNYPVTAELIVDALRYWVLEMHVDGFRFDLASILNRDSDGTPLPKAPVVEAISRDPILASTKLIAEAWDAGGLYQVGGFAPHTLRWSEWNGKYRDVVRRFIKGTPHQKNAFAGALSGSHDLYGQGRSPASSINFVTSHDGFSLADLVSYNGKHNLPNGEENRDGLNENESWNCGYEGPTYNKKVLNLRKRQLCNFHLALMVSQGVPMLLMGDEYAHSRYGNNNSWCQDNELNWFLWDQLEERREFFRFYRALIQFRKKHPLLRRAAFLNEKDVKWHGNLPDQPNWDQDGHLVAFTLHHENGAPGLYIAFNAGHTYQNLTFPSLGEGKVWRWVANTHNPAPLDFFEESKPVTETTFRIPPYSSIILSADL